MTGKVYVAMMVKDEADVITDVLYHLERQGVDGIIVADNGSTDGTRDLLHSAQHWLNCSSRILDDPEIAYHQSTKTSRLGEMAYDMGADWVIPIDADEIWSAPQPVGDWLRAMGPEVTVADAELYNYVPTDIDDPAETSPFVRIVHRLPEQSELFKVAVRWQPGTVIWMGNHGATQPHPGDRAGGLRVSHFPWRSPAQFERKCINGSRAYAAVTEEMPADAGAHWKAYGEAFKRGGSAALLDIYNQWFHFARPEDADPPLVRDPAPFLGRA